MIYTGFDVLVRDVIGYIRATGAQVLRADDPLKGMIGYTSEDETVSWSMSLLLFDSPRTELAQRFSKESNTDFVAWMQKEAQQGVITDPDFVKHFQDDWRKLLSSATRHGTGCHAGWKVSLPKTHQNYS